MQNTRTEYPIVCPNCGKTHTVYYDPKDLDEDSEWCYECLQDCWTEWEQCEQHIKQSNSVEEGEIE